MTTATAPATQTQLRPLGELFGPTDLNRIWHAIEQAQPTSPVLEEDLSAVQFSPQFSNGWLDELDLHDLAGAART